MAKKKVPNPWGKKGCPEHQQVINEIVEEIGDRDMDAARESIVKTPNGKKRMRFSDVAAVNRQNLKIEAYYQVGKAKKNGDPIARERQAMDDIEEATGIRPLFKPYNLVIFAVVLLTTAYLFA